MANNIIGIRNNNVILPYNATTKRTKEVALTVTSAQAGWSTTRAVGVFYADSNGVWRLRFNITGSITPTTLTTTTLTISNVAFKAGTNQACSGFWGNNATITPRVIALGSGGDIQVDSSSASSVAGVNVSGDVELNAEPTTYTTSANMEGVIAADVFIVPASAGVSGIVNNTSGNTAGTPIKGKTDGVAVSAGYVGETPGATTRTGAGGNAYDIRATTSFDASGTALVSVTLNKGVYLVGAVTQVINTGATPRNVGYWFTIGGIQVSADFSTLAGASGALSFVAIPMMPMIITADSTVVTLSGQFNSTGTSSGHKQSLHVVRIA
jgi:hypothetical protein